mmetsp:Transcript_41398/g.76610  ORF Transcript_41398/g.76610 Transcript_41398/m.76610 type:complete len:321 (-) Transcript_41398:336-1298(-)
MQGAAPLPVRAGSALRAVHEAALGAGPFRETHHPVGVLHSLHGQSRVASRVRHVQRLPQVAAQRFELGQTRWAHGGARAKRRRRCRQDSVTCPPSVGACLCLWLHRRGGGGRGQRGLCRTNGRATRVYYSFCRCPRHSLLLFLLLLLGIVFAATTLVAFTPLLTEALPLSLEQLDRSLHLVRLQVLLVPVLFMPHVPQRKPLVLLRTQPPHHRARHQKRSRGRPCCRSLTRRRRTNRGCRRRGIAVKFSYHLHAHPRMLHPPHRLVVLVLSTASAAAVSTSILVCPFSPLFHLHLQRRRRREAAASEALAPLAVAVAVVL